MSTGNRWEFLKSAPAVYKWLQHIRHSFKRNGLYSYDEMKERERERERERGRQRWRERECVCVCACQGSCLLPHKLHHHTPLHEKNLHIHRHWLKNHILCRCTLLARSDIPIPCSSLSEHHSVEHGRETLNYVRGHQYIHLLLQMALRILLAHIANS